MKKKATIILVVILIFVLGFITGKLMERFVHGYRYKVLEVKEVEAPFGVVSVEYVAESFGLALLNTETSIITLKSKYNSPVTIYKAQRVFQENDPHVYELSVTNNTIFWNDGKYDYSLNITHSFQPQSSEKGGE